MDGLSLTRKFANPFQGQEKVSCSSSYTNELVYGHLVPWLASTLEGSLSYYLACLETDNPGQ